MGGIDKLLHDIRCQFISLYDSVLFIANQDGCTQEQALNFIKIKMLDEQIYLLLIDGMHLTEVRLYHDDYYVDENYHGATITKDTIITELQESIAQDQATHTIENYGFGAKRFYETANNLGVNIPDDLLYHAQSPDCYYDNENPLTPIVKELQAEIKALKENNTEILKLRARIAELQAKQKVSVNDDKELTPRTQNALAKFLYALLVEHGYDLGAKKGNTNDILQALTAKHGVPLSRDFIATWLDLVNNLKK